MNSELAVYSDKICSLDWVFCRAFNSGLCRSRYLTTLSLCLYDTFSNSSPFFFFALSLRRLLVRQHNIFVVIIFFSLIFLFTAIYYKWIVCFSHYYWNVMDMAFMYHQKQQQSADGDIKWRVNTWNSSWKKNAICCIQMSFEIEKTPFWIAKSHK